MSARARFTARALALALAGCAGCGTTPLSLTQLRSSATQVCQQATKRAQRIPNPASPEAADAFLRRGIGVLRSEFAGLRALRPPNNLADTYRASLDDLSEQVRLLREADQHLAAGADPVMAVRRLQAQLAPLESRADANWRSLEIPACASQ